MKAVILAGGLGTRISEESIVKPKPMIEIGGKPILWHIMKIYSMYDINDFIICLGYKGYVIKEYFANYFLHMSDVTFDMEDNGMVVHQKHVESWRVTLVDTGDQTMTGGRIRRVRSYIGEEDFCCTYGDGVGNINIKELIDYHKFHKTWATLTAVQPPGRFGSLNISDNRVASFVEKPVGDGGWVNGGFFVFSPRVIDLIKEDDTPLEGGLMRHLAEMGQLSAYKHSGFWQPMDTLRDKAYLEGLWVNDNAPWKGW